MKIIFLQQDTGRLYGAEQATLDLACRLRDEPGFLPSFLLIHESRLTMPANDLQHQLTECRIPFTVLHTDHPFSLRLIRAIRTCIAEPCILHCTGYKADVHGWLAGHGRCPLMATVHGWLNRPDLKERFYAWLDVQFLKRFDGVVALSQYYRTFLIGSGIPAERLRLIHSPLPAPKTMYTPFPKPGICLTIGTLGRLSTEKNQELLLNAILLLRRKHPEVTERLRVLIAGDGPEKGRLEAFIKMHALEGIVTLCDFMPREVFFNTIDVFLLCSRIENFPLSILEAVAAHKPVIATRVGGIQDQLDDQSGILVTPGNPQVLADAMLFVLNHPDAMKRFSENALEQCLAKFSVSSWIQKHIQMYREVS